MFRAQAPPASNVLDAPASPQPPAATPPVRSELYEEEERLARAALERALVARGGLLLPRWTPEVEQNATCYNASSDLISIDEFTILPVLIVGDIVSERIRRDILRVAFTSRLGMPGGLQADFRLPFGYEKDRDAPDFQRQCGIPVQVLVDNPELRALTPSPLPIFDGAHSLASSAWRWLRASARKPRERAPIDI